MRIISLIQAGSAERFPAQLREAARAAFPEAVWREADPVTLLAKTADDPEIQRPDTPDGGGTLVFFCGDAPEAETAATLLDGDQLPRWGVVVFGEKETSLPVDDWSLPQLTRALRSAADHHAAQRGIAALRGDLLTMARRVSHDLRTPLGGVIATVDMLAEITPGGHAAVRPLFSSVDEITAIISRTAFLMKAIAQPAPKTAVSMADPVREALLRLEKWITRGQVTVSSPPAWPQVAGVESWLEVIWWNLVHNALRHAGDGPLIRLGWEPLEGGGRGYRFWIRDNGPGVTPAARGQLFRSFHLLHDPDAPRGFGLAIVRGLVDLQGGTCGYEPQSEGGGAGFYFTLPQVS